MADMIVVQEKLKAIAAAHTDYAKSSFEANKVYMEKLATVKAPDQAMTLVSEHMKTSYETFVAEATKIGEMYKDFFQSAFGSMAVTAPKLQVVA
jgi:ribosomal protein S17E